MTEITTAGNLQVYRKKLVGSGQFGKIVCGIYRKKREVAVTCVDKEEFHVDVSMLNKALKHSNILEYICTEENGQFQFLASELIAGTLLDHVTGDYKGPIIGTNRLILKQVTRGLAFLHEKKIFHRELKPSNIFISHTLSSKDGTLRPTMKLGNFGIYRKAGQKLLLEMPCSKSWLPPEAHGKFTFTAAMDLFALGCLYGFTLSRGRHPYGNDEENRVSRIKKKEPMTLTVEHLKNVESAASVFQLICSLLNADPTQRPSAKRVLKNAFFSKTLKAESGASLQDENSVESNTGPEPKTTKRESRKRKNDEKEQKSEKRNKTENMEKRGDENNKGKKKLEYKGIEPSSYISTVRNGSFRGDVKDAEPIMLANSILSLPHQSFIRPLPELSNVNEYKEIRTITYHGFQPALPQFDEENYASIKEAKLLKLSSQESLDAMQMLRFRQLVADRSVCVDCKTRYQETPLLLLCTRNQSDSLLPALEALLKRKDVNLQATYSSYNALNLLTRFYNHHPNFIRCFSLLIRRGISACQTDKDGQNPILLLSHLYSGEDLIDICRLLVRKISDSSTILRAAFILADRGFHQESKIIEKMTQSQQPNKKETELLEICSKIHVNKSDFKRIRKLALNAEVDINQPGPCGRSAFQLLFHFNRSKFLLKCVKALLERKSLDPDVTEGDGWNRLMIACFHHRDVHTLLEIVILLIDLGTDPHTTAYDGRNALHILCCRPTKNGVVPNLYEIVQVLLEAGSDVHVRAKDGSNCLIALATNHYQRPDFFPILRLLIQNGADVNAVSFKKQNVLSILCYKYEGEDFVAIVKLLLDYHVNTNCRDKYHNRPLDILIKSRGFQRDSEIVRLIRDSNKVNIYAPEIC